METFVKLLIVLIIKISLIVRKFEFSGLSDPIISWLSFYLHYPKRFVRIQNCHSSPISFTSGVPQGCHLSLLLFNILIKNVSCVPQFTKLLLVADVLQMFFSISSIADCHNLQSDLNHIVVPRKWSSIDYW